MKRAQLSQQLDDYKNRLNLSPEETSLIKRFEHFISEHPNCFERSLEKGHLTASCWLWNLDQTACLFTKHKKLKKWLQLGGHADGESNLLKVAIKEAQEESGILNIEPLFEEIFDIDIHEIPETQTEKAHLHYDVRFILQVQTSEAPILSNESDELKWILPEDFDLYDLDPSILRMKEKINTFKFSKK